MFYFQLFLDFELYLEAFRINFIDELNFG